MKKVFLITKIMSDHGGEFHSLAFENFREDNGFYHDFSPRTPQQNDVVERNKNRNLQEFARSMLNEYDLPKYF